ncbi:hypothetical protein ANN_07323 [Periplaneta americana]|uniref:Uncharacterized protein n=1 Tax=Periplaneta americana TaxID=6978 RepID=A0ABQ8SZG4_PERAM|nr:hypothetical protein ANN_07323 [Periplaneta americana]
MVGNSTENVDQPADDTPSAKNNVDDILHVPQFTMTSVSKPVRKRRNPAASVHLPKNGMPTGEEPACGPSTSSVLPECSNTSASTSTSASGNAKQNEEIKTTMTRMNGSVLRVIKVTTKEKTKVHGSNVVFVYVGTMKVASQLTPKIHL